MKLKAVICMTLLLFLQIKLSYGLDALYVPTDYADYILLEEGKELKLSCKNNVDNTQAVTWTPPKKVPHEAYTLDIQELKDGNVYTLTLKNPRSEYAGPYTCTSHTSKGDKITKDVHVGIPPKIVKFLVNGNKTRRDNQQFVFYNEEKVKFECFDDPKTYPTSVYVWKKNNVRLEDVDSNIMVITYKEDGTGIYACELANSIGSSKEHRVDIEYVPTTTTTQPKYSKTTDHVGVCEVFCIAGICIGSVVTLVGVVFLLVKRRAILEMCDEN